MCSSSGDAASDKRFLAELHAKLGTPSSSSTLKKEDYSQALMLLLWNRKYEVALSEEQAATLAQRVAAQAEMAVDAFAATSLVFASPHEAKEAEAAEPVDGQPPAKKLKE